jgi:hypothetical protein
MQWESISARASEVAEGREYTYLVSVDPDPPAIVLSRVRKGHLDRPWLALFAVTHAATSAIRFPLGRGPGRPGGEPELAALAESAKAWAEKFEAAAGALDWRTGEAAASWLDRAAAVQLPPLGWEEA